MLCYPFLHLLLQSAPILGSNLADAGAQAYILKQKVSCMFLGVCLPVRPLAQLSPAPGPSTAQHSARLGAKTVQIGFRLGSDWG